MYPRQHELSLVKLGVHYSGSCIDFLLFVKTQLQSNGSMVRTLLANYVKQCLPLWWVIIRGMFFISLHLHSECADTCRVVAVDNGTQRWRCVRPFLYLSFSSYQRRKMGFQLTIAQLRNREPILCVCVLYGMGVPMHNWARVRRVVGPRLLLLRKLRGRCNLVREKWGSATSCFLQSDRFYWLLQFCDFSSPPIANQCGPGYQPVPIETEGLWYLQQKGHKKYRKGIQLNCSSANGRA